MAEADTEETESELDSEATEESGGGKSKLIIIGVLVVILGAGGYFGYPYAMNMISPPDETEGEVVEEPIAKKPALFASLLPPLVVNIRDSYGDSHFMQMSLEVMAREQGIIDEVRNHAAVIRNSLILMYGSVDFDFVNTREGKEQMLADALSETQVIIERETGETGIEAVYFTALIIQ